MIRNLLIFLLLSFCFSCKPEPKVPKAILPPEKMQQVMADLMRVDEYVNQQAYTDTTKNITTRRFDLYQKVFKIHRTSKEQFNASFKFYQNHPDLLKIVIDSIHSKMTRETNPAFNPSKDSSLKK